MAVVQGFQDLIKELKEYGDKQKERHKQVKCPLRKTFWLDSYCLSWTVIPCLANTSKLRALCYCREQLNTWQRLPEVRAKSKGFLGKSFLHPTNRHWLLRTLTCPEYMYTCTMYLTPLIPNYFHIQISQTDLHTFSWRISGENLIKDQSISPLIIILLS